MKKFLLLSSVPLLLLSSDNIEKITVITGTKTVKLLEDSPIKMEVVTKKDIKNTHAKNISEALKYIPSLMIKETHGKQGQSVWIQGINSDRVLVLIDGEAMTSPTGSTVDLSQINIGDVEKIEIIKGASSALYGSQAMGGVINIITKEPKEGLSNSLTLEAGTFSSYNAQDLGAGLLRASSAYKNEEHIASIDFDYNHEGGIKLKNGRTYHIPEINKININALYKNKSDDFEWYFKPRYLNEKTVKPYNTYNPPNLVPETKTEKTNKYRLTLGANKEYEESKLKLNTFYENYTSNSIVDKDKTSYTEQDREANIKLYESEVQFDTSITDEHLLTLGASFQKEEMKQTNTKGTNTTINKVLELGSKATRNNKEFYIQDDWFVSDKLEIVPGLRYQDDSDFGSYASPKISTSYIAFNDGMQRINIRVSYGNGYKIPTLKERFFFFDHSAFGYQVLGNPNLKPEKSNSYQLSTEYIKKDDYSMALNLFYNDITNLIESIKDNSLSASTGLEIYRYENINEAYTKGLELEFSKNFLSYFNIKGGYTYLLTKNKSNNKELIKRPKHQFKTRLLANYKNYTAILALIKESKEYVDVENKLASPSKTMVDLKLTKQVNKLFSIYGGIDNLFNEHKDPDNNENDLRTKRPRYIYIGTNYKF